MTTIQIESKVLVMGLVDLSANTNCQAGKTQTVNYELINYEFNKNRS